MADVHPAVGMAGAAALTWLLQANGMLATQTGLIWLAVGLGSFATGATSVVIMTASMAFAAQSDRGRYGHDRRAKHA